MARYLVLALLMGMSTSSINSSDSKDPNTNANKETPSTDKKPPKCPKPYNIVIDQKGCFFVDGLRQWNCDKSLKKEKGTQELRLSGQFNPIAKEDIVDGQKVFVCQYRGNIPGVNPFINRKKSLKAIIGKGK